MVFTENQDISIDLSFKDILSELYSEYTLTDIFEDWPSDSERETLIKEIKEE